MATHHLAQGLASLGRHGDSMLMHVSPSEVAGLQALGEMTGSRLHTNPDTGLPEAFDFGDFFSSLLPTLVGVGLSPATGGASLGLTGMSATAAPILGGMATGALVAGAKGEDVLGGALMGGLGGYGGGNLGSSLAKMGGATPATANLPLTTSNVMKPTGITNIGQGVQLGQFKDVIPTDQLSTAFGNTGDLARNLPTTNLTAGMPVTTGAGATGGFDALLKGASGFASDPFGQFGAFKEAGGSAMQIGAPLGMAALSAMQPEPIDMSEEEARRKAEENKYRGSTGGLNLSASSGLNLGLPSLTLASGGVINANQSTISSGGTQDLYGSPDNTTGNPPLSQDGYGIGRLDKLAQQGSLTKAGDMFYAAGGPVSFAEGGGAETSLNVNTGKQQRVGSSNELNNMLDRIGFFRFSPFGIGNIMGSGVGESSLSSNYLRNPFLHALYRKSGNLKGEPKSYALNVISGQQEPQYAHGGYLDGAGDGMSDSIPATIEGKQPARLADGEFVVPADVVSHIGNGSSKAGSKRLYAMLDKVRKARTGHTKQGREINPNKYLPA